MNDMLVIIYCLGIRMTVRTIDLTVECAVSGINSINGHQRYLAVYLSIAGDNPMLVPFAAGNGKNSPSPSRVRFSRTGQSRFYRVGGEVS